MRRIVLALAVAAAVAGVAGLKPGQPGYRVPWNRPARDSVVDLDPGARGPERIEFRGRLVASDGVSPLANAALYAYHADSQGAYADAKYPDLNHKAGVVRTGPGGGFVLRSTLPGMYEGPPHIHLDADIAGRNGRCTWWVSFRPDSASWPLAGTVNLGPASRPSSDEHFAILHRDPDGVLRTRRTLHTAGWFEQPELDSIRAAIAAKYERSPWRPKP